MRGAVNEEACERQFMHPLGTRIGRGSSEFHLQDNSDVFPVGVGDTSGDELLVQIIFSTNINALR
jgi:hypothetical protein